MTEYGIPIMGWYNYGNSSSGDWSAPHQNQNYPTFNMMGYGYGYGPEWGYMGIWGWFFMVIFWALIIAGVIALIRGFRHGCKMHRHGTGSAIEILKERYAKGEIDKKEFEEKRKDLE
ncbi:MAG TPA: SHOCT domain-containing protein [Candidatus Paceibacterota bacterium]|nr:SHOCT domain-containing protein [Candidatus Paceibacterota bacterium]